MTYRFDSELAPWISMVPQLDLTDIAGTRRDLLGLLDAARESPPVGDLTVEDRIIPGPDGAPDVRLRIYTPAGRPGPFPAMLFLHAGGFVFGSIEHEDATARSIADGADAVVVSVDYRLAPECPYPAALDDSYAALSWLHRNAAELNVAPTRIGVGGASAGGGLAAATALLARDRAEVPLCMQYLEVPELDDRLDTPSMRAYTDTPIWDRHKAELSWQAYLGGAVVDGYAAPARAADLAGLPPSFVAVAQFDPLRDEGIDYAQRLAQANVPTELHLYPGTFHGSFLVAEAQVSRRMAQDTSARIRALLHADGSPFT